MLEDPETAMGGCDVVIRARSERETPVLHEVEALAAARGARLHVLMGPRGTGWAPAHGPQSLAAFMVDPASTDVFICGPARWSDMVEEDARRAGLPAEAIHREVFSW